MNRSLIRFSIRVWILSIISVYVIIFYLFLIFFSVLDLFILFCGDCMFSSETYELEDCTYYNSAEVTRSTTNGSTIYDNNLAIALPSNCEITLEAWSDNSARDSGEHRFFMLPKSQYSSGTTQPQYGLYFDLLGQNNAKFGKRQSNSSVNVGSSFSATRSTYHSIKLVKNGTSIAFYFNDDLKATESESWIDNYSDYTFSMMRWGTSGTSRLRNVKIKPL